MWNFIKNVKKRYAALHELNMWRKAQGNAIENLKETAKFKNIIVMNTLEESRGIDEEKETTGEILSQDKVWEHLKEVWWKVRIKVCGIYYLQKDKRSEKQCACVLKDEIFEIGLSFA